MDGESGNEENDNMNQNNTQLSGVKRSATRKKIGKSPKIPKKTRRQLFSQDNRANEDGDTSEDDSGETTQTNSQTKSQSNSKSTAKSDLDSFYTETETKGIYICELCRLDKKVNYIVLFLRFYLILAT